ncbi:early protein GP4 [Bacillus altitudinis]|uniref:early protein GP4 n=1 Tax=Bacillus altitudinis TaxID=293387 RepID=UPI003D1A6261
MSKRGIFYDLNESYYKYETLGVTYVFSSKLYLNKFKDEYRAHRTTTLKKMRLPNNIDFEVNEEFNIMCDMNLYLSIEKRGFLLHYRGVDYICQDNLRFVLQTKIELSLKK